MRGIIGRSTPSTTPLGQVQFKASSATSLREREIELTEHFSIPLGIYFLFFRFLFLCTIPRLFLSYFTVMTWDECFEFCRARAPALGSGTNVFIYFNNKGNRKMLRQLDLSLSQGGRG